MAKRNAQKGWDGEDEAILAGLLHDAGPREPLAVDLEGLRRGVEESWRLGRGPGRRFQPSYRWAAAAALLAATLGTTAVLLWPRLRPAPPVEPYATLWQQTGPVEILGGGGPANGQRRLGPGDEVVTGDGGRVAFRLEGKRSLRLDEGSRLRFRAGRRVELLAGAVYSDSGKGAGEGSEKSSGADPPDAGPPARGLDGVTVATPFGEIRELGTQFEARLAPGEEREGPSLRLKVRQGKVVLTASPADGARVVEAGEELIAEAGGDLRRRSIRPDDPAWSWVAEAVPRMEIEGASLAELLDWTAREGGWELRYAEPDGRRQARKIFLHGSLEGLGLLEGLELVMEGSGYRARKEGSALVVETVRTPN